MSSNGPLAAALSALVGRTRRQLLLLTTLYFSILFLESEVGHMPLLAGGWQSLALIPVVWLAVSLLSLMALLLWPSGATGRLAQIVMVVAGIVGIIGVFPHFAANGVTWSHLSALANGSFFHGEPGPQWPLAITIGGVLGFIGAYGVADDTEFQRETSGWLKPLAFLLLLCGIALSDVLATLGWGAMLVVVAALFLLAITLVDIASAMTAEREA